MKHLIKFENLKIKKFKNYRLLLDKDKNRIIDIETFDFLPLFNEINKDCFYNKLKPITIVAKESIEATGQYRSKYNKKSKEILEDYILITTSYDLTYDKLRNVLCHEMIHYYLAHKHTGLKIEHGTKFKNEMNRINRLNKGYNITIVDIEPGEKR